MIQSFEVSEHDIAFYSGVLIAVFTFGEFLTGVFWAWVSDKIGRKPTLLIGIFCGLVTTLSFGLSRSVAVAIASRAFGGLLNPNVGLVQTCTGELARKEQRGEYPVTPSAGRMSISEPPAEHQTAKAFSLVTFIRSLG
jgi:MFS family permease